MKTTNTERWDAQERLRECLSDTNGFWADNRKHSVWEKIDIAVHRAYNTYVYPIWSKLKGLDELRANGFARSDTWDLSSAHATWILPRLKHLRDNFTGMPMKGGHDDAMSSEEWRGALHKMCRAFWLVLERDRSLEVDVDPLTHELIDEGLALFAKHYLDLWD